MNLNLSDYLKKQTSEKKNVFLQSCDSEFDEINKPFMT